MLTNTLSAVGDNWVGQPDQGPAPVVLVVDDDPAIQDLLQDLFDSVGYRVEVLADGQAALARVRAGGIDLAILDRMLPGLDGAQLCQAIRALEGQAYLPIIMLTALALLGQHYPGARLGPRQVRRVGTGTAA